MQLKAGENTYEIGELTLGEFRVLRKHFEVARMDQLDPRDPDHLVGLLYLAARRANPKRTHEDLLAEVEAITEIDFADEDGAEADPPSSSESPSDTEQPASDGEPATSD